MHNIVLRSAVVMLFSLGVFLNQAAVGEGNPPSTRDCLHLTGEKNIKEISSSLQKKKQAEALDLGNDVTALITPWPTDEKQEARLTVKDQKKKVASFREYMFTKCFRLESGPAQYWLIEGWSGAAHGGYQHHYFCRPKPAAPLRFLATIRVGDRRSEETFGRELIRCRNSQAYVRYDDDRFADFATSYALSSALLFPKFYRLTPTGLRLDNQAFPEEYHQEIAKIEAEIQSAGAEMQFKLAEISLGTELGVWLVARTIHYLVLREEKQAWESLKRDVARYYQSSAGLDELTRRIKKVMGKSPY